MRLKKILIAIIVIFVFLIILAVWNVMSKYSIFFSKATPISKPYVLSATDPGIVANVFGWGYERSICQIPNSTAFVVFFFAQDNHIHYVYSTNLKKVFHIPQPRHQNPDHTILCDGNLVTVFYSDDNQSEMHSLTGTISDINISWENDEVIKKNSIAFTMVAPSAALINGITYVSYMEYGQGGKDSKAYVLRKDENSWSSPTLIDNHSSASSPIFGNSVAEYQGKPFVILSPPSSETKFTTMHDDLSWTLPAKQSGMNFFGQLEWNAISTEDGIHMVYRAKNTLVYAFLSNSDQKIYSTSIYKNPGTLNFSIFEDNKGNIYSIEGFGEIRKLLGKDGVGKPQNVFNKNHPMLTWVRTPERLYTDILPVISLLGENPYFKIKYETVDLKKLQPFEKDDSSHVLVQDMHL